MLGEADVPLDARQQWAAVDFLKHQIEFLIILEEFDQLQDARMSLTVMECLHFAKDTRTRMSRYLIDNLHSIFQIGVDVHARLHRCISPFAEYFAT